MGYHTMVCTWKCCGRCCLVMSIASILLLLALWDTLRKGDYIAIGVAEENAEKAQKNCKSAIYCYIIIAVLSLLCLFVDYQKASSARRLAGDERTHRLLGDEDDSMNAGLIQHGRDGKTL